MTRAERRLGYRSMGPDGWPDDPHLANDQSAMAIPEDGSEGREYSRLGFKCGMRDDSNRRVHLGPGSGQLIFDKDQSSCTRP